MLCDLVDDYGLLSYLPLDVNVGSCTEYDKQSTTSVQKIVEVIDKANGFSLYSLIADTEPSKQTDQIMGMFAKNDVSYDDMVDGEDLASGITCRDE